MFRGIEKKEKEIAVIQTLWKRIHQLSETLNQMKIQSFKEFDFYVINNNNQARESVDEIVKKANMPTTVFHCEENFGPMIRFILAKKLYEAGYKYVIFLDDDEGFFENTISTFEKEKEPKSLKAVFALNFPETFEGKTQMANVNCCAKYVGPGGMIADASIFAMEEFWNQWLPEFYIIDDFWLSFFAKSIGWKCTRSGSPIQFLADRENEGNVPTWKRKGVVKLREFFIQHYGWN